MRIRSLVVVAAISLSTYAVSQRRPTSTPDSTAFSNPASDKTEIQVRVTGENGRSLNDVLRVQLLGSGDFPIAEGFTNKEGSCELRNLHYGRYRIRVTASTIEEKTTPPFQIVNGESVHMEYITVKPKAVESGGASSTNPVSAQEMTVPDKARKEYEKGVQLLEAGDLQKAEKYLQKALEIYPKYARAWDAIGVARVQGGDQAGATDAWRKAIEVDNKCASAFFHLARQRILQQEPEKAQSLVEKGLSATPGDPDGLYLLTVSQAMQRKWDQALANARRVHSAERHNPDVHMIAAQGLAEQNHPNEAIAEYEQYLKEYPDSPRAAQVRESMAQLQAKAH